jgi:hypothetical protein
VDENCSRERSVKKEKKPSKPQEPAKDEEFRQIREALREAVERTSLRGVARELSMSPTGLRGLIDGAAPYVKTQQKVRIWLASYDRDVHGDLPTSTVAGVLRRLLWRVPGQSRSGAEVRVLNGFEEAFRFGGVEVPAWVAEIRQGLIGGTDEK